MKKWKCTICSYIHDGDEPPEKCLACGAEKNMIVEVVGDEQKQEHKEIEKEEESTSKNEVLKQSGEAETRKWKCTICNYIHVGDGPPEKCPVCGADKSVFIEIVEEGKKEEAEPEAVEVKTSTPEPVQAPEFKDKIANLVMRHHLHPITVHTPNGVIPVAVVFLVLATVLGIKAFEMAAFFNLIFVLFTMPVVVFTGYLTWQKKYNGAKTSIFVTKIICSAIVAVLLGWLVCWRLIDPEVALSGETSAWVYLAISGVVLCAVGIAGHLGGKLVFGSSNK
jgi:rubredoxin/uncharacterized membrane protein